VCGAQAASREAAFSLLRLQARVSAIFPTGCELAPPTSGSADGACSPLPARVAGEVVLEDGDPGLGLRPPALKTDELRLLDPILQFIWVSRTGRIRRAGHLQGLGVGPAGKASVAHHVQRFLAHPLPQPAETLHEDLAVTGAGVEEKMSEPLLFPFWIQAIRTKGKPV
jgi:hypothetical protein